LAHSWIIWSLTHIQSAPVDFTQTAGAHMMTYSMSLNNTTLVVSYQFQPNASLPQTFVGVNFMTPPGTLKWSVELVRGWPFGSAQNFSISQTLQPTSAQESFTSVALHSNYPESSIMTY
jgi:hypothetical protein